MYRAVIDRQVTFYDFNQSCGMQLDEENEWVLLADRMPWEEMDKEYALMFPSRTGHPAIPLRAALGALIIQHRKNLSDRKLMKEISENPYLQYFIGNTSFQKKEPFRPTTLVAIRKRLGANFLMRANELCLENAKETPAHRKENESHRARQAKEQDEHGNLGNLEDYMSEGYAMPRKYISQYLTILELYRQQKYMFDNKTHVVENRIMSINQPFVRPMVRGKAKAQTEFGAKYDVSIDEKGHARLEKISFDPYNESSVFQDAMERYFERTGHYPRRVLADQIYRTRDNLAFCKERHIELSGPKLGRPSKSKRESPKDEWQDNTDRIEVERFFSVNKRCNGAGLIKTKPEETAMGTIAMAILVTNLFAVIFLSFIFRTVLTAMKAHIGSNLKMRNECKTKWFKLSRLMSRHYIATLFTR